ncbi:DUF4192 domain-containing protein [Humibacter sp. RRB41]|uniref:DUF4192 domain-containing protein n=1 Tax=Humibacter sp. RRB41 TaxID=2919946 RepID=UPI001FAAF5A9|nr:DUF4192 domain-containing protein [Humibacter sp. RRB41]
MPDHVIAPDTVSLLALVPELVGFQPRASLVLVTFRDGLSGGTLRVDLPPGADDLDEENCENLRRFAATLIGMVCKVRGADALLAVAYSDASCADGAPAAGLARELRQAASTAGFPLLDLLYVAADGWGDYEQGRRGDRGALDSALWVRRTDSDAGRLRRSPREEAALPAVAPKERSRTAEALEVLRSKAEQPDPIWFAEYSAGWREEEVGAIVTALTAHVLSYPWARDVVLFTWGWGVHEGRRALRFQERHSRGEPVDDEEIAMALAGQSSLRRPSTPRVERAIRLLREVAARLTGADRAPALASLAWLNWALGRGSLAGEYVEQARAVDPGYSFAELVETMLTAGMLPEWVFREPQASRQARRAAARGRRA